MALCKGCGAIFQWGFCDGRWVPLEPIATHANLPRTYVDENGELRADHRDRHGPGGSSVNVTRLDRKVFVPSHAPAPSEEDSAVWRADNPQADLREEADLEAAGKDCYGSLQ